MTYIVAIAEGDMAHAESLRHYLADQGYRVTISKDGASLLKSIAAHAPDFALINTILPDGDGFSILKKLREKLPDTSVIMISNYGSVDAAVRAMKLGAMDYMVKPLDYENLTQAIRKGLMRSKQNQRRMSLLSQRRERYRFSNIIGASPVFLKTIHMAEKIAASPAVTVLIQGESGTGKELFASAIHYNSSRADHAFVEINCSAIPEGLLEAELFGHEKGAFTGAVREKKGLFEVAHRGTVFLDEIGHMPLALQAKLVKVIEEKNFRRVGGEKSMYFDARIIAATNRDLRADAESGLFRSDLFYRLQVMTIHLPSLRERGPDDILLLARHFLEVFNREYQRNVQGFTEGAVEALVSYPWPGNVRELRNTIERIIVLDPGPRIRREHLQLPESHVAHPSNAVLEYLDRLDFPDEGIPLDDVLALLMRKAYRKADGNKSRAAAYLGISRDAFRYRWKKLEGAGAG